MPPDFTPYAERVATIESEVKHIREDMDELRAMFSKQQLMLEMIQSELTARREFTRGMKAGIALMWTLLGGAAAMGIEKVWKLLMGLTS